MAGRQGEKCNYSNYLPTHLGDHDDDMVIMKKGDEKNVIGPIIWTFVSFKIVCNA